MTRTTLDRATIELLQNLGEPLEFCDETGRLLGTFIPAEAESVKANVVTEEAHPHEAHESLGEEMNLFGYEMDLE